jgi:hypothetical protein
MPHRGARTLGSVAEVIAMTIQERFGALETEARGRIRRVLSKGNERLMELDERLAKIARDDWTVPGLRRHIDDLRVRAESLRVEATKKAQELPNEAVHRIAAGTRAPIQNLAKGLAGLAKRLEPPGPKAVKTAEPPQEPKVKAS